MLLLVAFTLFRPGFFWDKVYPELTERPASELTQIVGQMNPGEQLRIELKGEKMNGTEFKMTVMLPVGEEPTGEERLEAIGVETREEDGRMFVDNVVFSSPAEKAGIDFDQEILNIQLLNDRPPKQLMFIPALLLLALVWYLQKKRVGKNIQAVEA